MQATAALTPVLTCFLSIKLVLQTTYRIPAARTISTGSAQTDGIGLCVWLSTKATSGEEPNAPIHEVQGPGC